MPRFRTDRIPRCPPHWKRFLTLFCPGGAANCLLPPRELRYFLCEAVHQRSPSHKVSALRFLREMMAVWKGEHVLHVPRPRRFPCSAGPVVSVYQPGWEEEVYRGDPNFNDVVELRDEVRNTTGHSLPMFCSPCPTVALSYRGPNGGVFRIKLRSRMRAPSREPTLVWEFPWTKEERLYALTVDLLFVVEGFLRRLHPGTARRLQGGGAHRHRQVSEAKRRRAYDTFAHWCQAKKDTDRARFAWPTDLIAACLFLLRNRLSAGEARRLKLPHLLYFRPRHRGDSLLDTAEYVILDPGMVATINYLD